MWTGKFAFGISGQSSRRSWTAGGRGSGRRSAHGPGPCGRGGRARGGARRSARRSCFPPAVHRPPATRLPGRYPVGFAVFGKGQRKPIRRSPSREQGAAGFPGLLVGVSEPVLRSRRIVPGDCLRKVTLPTSGVGDPLDDRSPRFPRPDRDVSGTSASSRAGAVFGPRQRPPDSARTLTARPPCRRPGPFGSAGRPGPPGGPLAAVPRRDPTSSIPPSKE